MLRHILLPSALVAASVCATALADERSAHPASAQRPVEVRVDEKARKDEAPARVETTVGTFEVREKNAELLRRMIAGDKVPVQFYAGGVE